MAVLCGDFYVDELYGRVVAIKSRAFYSISSGKQTNVA